MSVAVKDVAESEFQAEVLEATEPVIVDFWAPWCGPCKVVGPEIEKLASRTTGVKFVKVNVDESRDVAVRYGVMSIPTIAKFESGTLVSQVVGARSADSLGREFGLA